MDLGYKRELFVSGIQDKNNQMNLIKGHSVNISRQKYTISNQVKFIYILLSTKNNGKNSHETNMANIKQFGNINAYLLSEGDHLNSYDKSPILKVHQKDFDDLDKLLKIYL